MFNNEVTNVRETEEVQIKQHELFSAFFEKIKLCCVVWRWQVEHNTTAQLH